MVEGAQPARASLHDASIDLLRAVAVVAGLALHAAVPYLTRPVPELVWAVRDPATHPFADLVFWWGRFAQVQLFFVVAGWLTVRVYAARGPADFLAARTRRLGIPFAAGTVFVLPILAMVWAWGWTLSGRATWSEVWTWRFADLEIQRNSVGPAHLWFLEDLVAISLAAWALWRCGAIGLTGRWLRGAWVVPALATLGIGLLWMWPATVLAVPNTFMPDLARLAYGATYFAGGAWLATRAATTARWPGAPLLIGLASLAAWAAVPGAGPASARSELMHSVFIVAAGWLSALGCLGLAARARPGLPEWVRRLATVTYPVYVLHLPVVGLLHVLLYQRLSYAPVAVVFVAVAGLVATWVLAEAVIAAAERLRTTRFTLPMSAAVTTAVVTMGIGLRVLHYVRNPDVWHDEAALLVNVLERDYGSLLGPLTYHEAAPPLFLWFQRAMALGAGDSTWVMRLAPLAASCLSLVALVPVARRLRPWASHVALLLMACSTQLIAHSVEAKPYAIDVLLATLAAAFVVTTREWPVARRVAVCVCAAPLVIFASYPGAFVMGGLAAAMVWTNLRERSRRGWVLIGVLAFVCVASFAGLVAGPARAQRSAAILANWDGAFPAGYDPVSVMVWLARALVGLADYCFRPFGGVLLLPIGVGMAVLWRRQEHALVVLLVVPIALAVGAGLAGEYPFSGSRVMIYALPALAVLCAEGLARIADLLGDRSTLLRATVVAVTMLPPVVLSARDAINPRSRPETAAAARVVFAARRPGELVASGNWEPRYYFRTLGSQFVRLDERPLPSGEARIWCVVHGPTPEDRQRRLAQAAGDAYRIVSSTDLAGVSVIEIGANR